MPKKWSHEEDELLKNNYQLKKEELITLLPNRTQSAICGRAHILGLKKLNRRTHCNHNDTNLDKLLYDTPISYYWVGFLLADGHFDKKGGITLNLSVKDEKHIAKFAEFINANVSYFLNNKSSMCLVNATNSAVVKNITNKFDINSNKTYNPPNLSFILDKSLFLSLLIGYIDGDGCIRKQTSRQDVSIQFHVHSSWIDFLFLVKDRLFEYFETKSGIPVIGNDGHAKSNISNSIITKALKSFAIENNLPILERKWDKIDLEYLSFKERGKNRRNLAIQMINNNCTLEEIDAAIGVKNIKTFLRKAGIKYPS